MQKQILKFVKIYSEQSKRTRLFFLLTLFLIPNFAHAAAPQIQTIANDVSATGITYTKTPMLTSGGTVTWRKEFGPDDMIVDPNTGAVSWAIPSGMPRESFHLGVRATNADGSVYITWILKVGGGNYIYVGPTDTYKTISAGTAAAASGDTIVIRDGIYTGDVNILESSNGQGTSPPSGTSSAYTTIMAEHPGGALIDGENARIPINLNGNWDSRDQAAYNSYDLSYIAIKGLVAGRSNSGGPIYIGHAHHIKIIDCGGYDQSMNDSGAVLQASRSDYVLIEGCYTFGNGRYGINLYISDNSIIRRCVVRIDRTHTYDPIGGIFNYAGQNGAIQNSMVIDSDQIAHYYHQYDAGAFDASSGGARYDDWGTTKNIKMSDNIALNDFFVGLANTHNGDNSEAPANQSDATNFTNGILWDMHSTADDSTAGGETDGTLLLPGDASISQLTIGKIRTYQDEVYGAYFNAYPSDRTHNMTNSIVTDVKNLNGTTGGPLFYDWNTTDHNNIFDTGTIDFYSASSTNTIATNPTTSCLRYLPRIEAGCPLQAAGCSAYNSSGVCTAIGARVGANIMNMRGKSGTLYGDAGYDDDLPAVPMWPYPHEDLIKQKMQAYNEVDPNTSTVVSGDRGFASSTATQLNGLPQTLTSYIWEYLKTSPTDLSHQMPAEIYGITTMNGQCGAANTSFFSTTIDTSTPGLCSPGSPVISGTDPWSWMCSGILGGNPSGTCNAKLDNIAPTISAFTLPASSSTNTVNITTFTASDTSNGGETNGSSIASYCVQNSNLASACNWLTTKPTTVTTTGMGSQTVYAWVKDGAGNISNPASAQVTTPVTLGETAQLGDDSGNTGTLWAQQSEPLTQSGTLQSMSFFVGSITGTNPKTILGIYASNAGGTAPGALIASTSSFVPQPNQWNVQTLTAAQGQSLNLTAGKTYWLAYQVSVTGGLIHFASNGTGTTKSYTYTYGAMPTTFASSFTSGTYHFSLFANLSQSADAVAPSAPSSLSVQ